MTSFMEWHYVVETSKDGVNWTYPLSPFDDKDQAIAACKELKDTNKRVRQFKVTVFRDAPEPLMVPANYDGPPLKAGTRVYVPDLVPAVPWFCPSHPTNTMMAFQTSEPRCKDCRQTMFQGDGLTKIEELK